MRNKKEVEPVLLLEYHTQGSLHCLISKFERKQEMQFADYKRALERIKVWIEMETQVSSAKLVHWAPGNSGEWLYGQCYCQNLAKGDKGQG